MAIANYFTLKELKAAEGDGRARVANVPGKGIGLVAGRDLPRGTVVAYYTAKVMHRDAPSTPGINYTIEVWTRENNPSRRFIGDIDRDSLQPPVRGISHLGFMSNEPSPSQQPNATLTHANNYKAGRQVLKVGDMYTFKLITTRAVKAREEILWCYGNDYSRDYPTGCP